MHEVEMKQPLLVHPRESMSDDGRPKGRSPCSPVRFAVIDHDARVGEGEECLLQQGTCLQRSFRSRKPGPKRGDRINLEFYPHLSKGSSPDVFEKPCGGADVIGEVTNLHTFSFIVIPLTEHKCERRQPRQPFH